MIDDPKILELKARLRARRLRMSSTTSERAYAQMDRSLRGTTRSQCSGDSSESLPATETVSSSTSRTTG
jgi:hypothetical protein